MGLFADREVLGLLHHDRPMHQPQPILSCYCLHQRGYRLGATGLTCLYLAQVATSVAPEDWRGIATDDWFIVC